MFTISKYAYLFPNLFKKLINNRFDFSKIIIFLLISISYQLLT
jgi:hypothetical protein